MCYSSRLEKLTSGCLIRSKASAEWLSPSPRVLTTSCHPSLHKEWQNSPPNLFSQVSVCTENLADAWWSRTGVWQRTLLWKPQAGQKRPRSRGSTTSQLQCQPEVVPASDKPWSTASCFRNAVNSSAWLNIHQCVSKLEFPSQSLLLSNLKCTVATGYREWVRTVKN